MGRVMSKTWDTRRRNDEREAAFKKDLVEAMRQLEKKHRAFITFGFLGSDNPIIAALLLAHDEVKECMVYFDESEIKHVCHE